MTLEMRGVTVRYGTGRRAVTAVDGVNLTLEAGRSLGLVGESGSGKSSLGRAAVGLCRLSAGSASLDGADVAARPNRGRAQLVFQDPYSSLDPRMSVGDSIAEGLAGRGRRRRHVASIVGVLLEQVGLDTQVAGERPTRLSGGQRQRVALARALAAEPTLLVADEITSALDVSVQGAVLNVVRDLQRSRGFSLLFISHNLAVVRYVADTIAVMYCGRIVEVAPTEELIAEPKHPYTRSLLASVPRLAPGAAGDGAHLGADPVVEAPLVGADPPDPAAPPSGCRFHPRCPSGPMVHPDRQVCAGQDPSDEADQRAHNVACFFPAPGHPVASGAAEGRR